MELSCSSQEEVDSWKASFLRAGVYPERQTAPENDENGSTDQTPSLDPQLERQVETIRNLVDSYMKIVTKTFRDLVPKIIMKMIINDTIQFLNTELLAQLYAAGDQNQLMEESAQEARRREEMLRMYHACKEALKIIGDVAMSTSYQPTPPPVKEWTLKDLNQSLPSVPSHPNHNIVSNSRTQQLPSNNVPSSNTFSRTQQLPSTSRPAPPPLAHKPGNVPPKPAPTVPPVRGSSNPTIIRGAPLPPRPAPGIPSANRQQTNTNNTLPPPLMPTYVNAMK